MPRARARRSVSNCNGVADPSNAATGAGSSGVSGTTSRPAGVSAGIQLRGDVLGHDRRGAQPDDAGGRQCLTRPLDPRRATLAVGQDQHQTGIEPVAGRWPWRNVSRSR